MLWTNSIILEYGSTHDSILKYKLWIECEKTCPYSGKPISFEQLFGGSGEIQIEHIMPWSRSLDDSFMNKTSAMPMETERKEIAHPMNISRRIMETKNGRKSRTVLHPSFMMSAIA